MRTKTRLWIGLLVERVRLQWHFIWTERQLRRRDVSGLSETQRKNRSLLIDHLRAYGQRGVFPINTRYAHKTPIFVDDGGRRCAVADLMAASGNMKIVDTVSAQANTAYIPEMKFPQLDEWAEDHGFTRAELTKIQPAYPVYLSLVTINTAFVWASLFAVFAGIVHWRHPWKAQQAGRVISALAVSLAGLWLFLSSYWLTRDLYPVAAYTFGPITDLCRFGTSSNLQDCRPVPQDDPCPYGTSYCESPSNTGYFVRVNFLFPFAPYPSYNADVFMVVSEDRPGFPFPPAVPPVQKASGQPSTVIMTTYDGNRIWGLTLAGYIIGAGLIVYSAIRLIREARRSLPDGVSPATS